MRDHREPADDEEVDLDRAPGRLVEGHGPSGIGGTADR